MAYTYELVRGFLRQVVRAAGERLSEQAREAAQPFCGAKPDIDWQDPATRKAHLAELVGMARVSALVVNGRNPPQHPGLDEMVVKILRL